VSLLTELRYPTTRRAKVITAVLAVVFFWLLATVIISALLLYRIVSPSRAGAEIDPMQLLGHPEIVSFPLPQGGEREAWFFPGLRNAPTVLLCHGYQSDRGQLLTLVTALQENRYNVLLFDFSGHGRTGGRTTLGAREAEEVRAAIEFLAARGDVDAERFGVWGANLGAYAAISAATREKRIRALVVDSVYANPLQMLQIEIDQAGLGILPLVKSVAGVGYRLINIGVGKDTPLVQRLSELEGVPKLFIGARNQPQLAELTRQLFLASPEPRKEAIAPKAYAATLSEMEKREYENLVVSFFLENLSLLRAPAPPPGKAPR